MKFPILSMWKTSVVGRFTISLQVDGAPPARLLFAGLWPRSRMVYYEPLRASDRTRQDNGANAKP